ncbi:hypothetical protein GCM10009122_47650 [Fulvivirga kasyanovii]|uniref:hypothetical protein n=1 Tax=Fulvivirga kasyanovii TaxID=396812 RepID=UPI0031D183D7
MNKYFTYILFPVSLALFIGFSACQEDDELPPITSEGKNTFGCLVNGELWLPKGALGQGGTFAQMKIWNDTVGATLYADNVNTTSGITISFFDVPHLRIDKSYDLTDSTYFIQYSRLKDGKACFYENVVKGNLKLSEYNIDQKILSGTFEFKAYSDVCNDTVTITEGRFDIGEIMQ